MKLEPINPAPPVTSNFIDIVYQQSFDNSCLILHNESIMAVLDFFKKKASDSNGVQNHDSAGVQAPSPTPTITETTTTVGAGPQRYSGIGNPPGGKAYSGIGNPPSPSVPAPLDSPIPTVPPPPPSPQVPPAGGPQPVVPGTPAVPGTPTEPTPPTGTPNAPGTTPDKPTDPANPDKQLDSSIDSDKRTQLDLMTHLTQRSNRVFVTAQQKAQELKSDFVDSEHVLHGLLADPEIYKYFTENKVPPQSIEQELEKVYKKGANEKPQISPRVKRVLENALVMAPQ